MKTHTQLFKEEIAKLGRQIDNVITYGNTTLRSELFSVTPHFEGNILKSVMKELDIEASVDIPLNTIINYQFGLKAEEEFEYLDFGNYVVFKSEKNEDKNTYTITCYDKMLYAMKQNEDLGVTYPITIKNYLSALATKIGLTLKNTEFYNRSINILEEKYVGLEYTYRDILDEIAQATGSIIIINADDQIEVKYPTSTGDTIDKKYLNEVNVKFGEVYGPVNSIVLSRAGESDNVYLRDEESVLENGLCEIKIVDNQLMNGNDRSDYLQGILSALDGLTYCITDFTSKGIMYYEVGDFYNVSIDNETYQCLMLNDEINVMSGVSETIHADMPEESQTDYSKADKTDRRLNQTYLIVDKQNQVITSVVSNVSEQNEKITVIEQTVDELNSKITEIADITTSGESSYASVSLTDVNASEPVRLEVRPIGTNISYLYPRDNLYPSDTLYMPNRIVRFTNTSTNEVFDYELPRRFVIL